MRKVKSSGKTTISADRLSSLFEETGVRQADLAEAAFCSVPHLSAVCNGRKVLTFRLADTICRAFDAGIYPAKRSANPPAHPENYPIILHGLRPSWLLGLDEYRTEADRAQYEKHIADRLSDHRNALNQELVLDEAWRHLAEALGYSIAVGRNEYDDPAAFIRNSKGEDTAILKEQLEALRYSCLSFMSWSFDRLFTEKKEPGAGQAKEGN